jgi:hypothetical protein
MTDSAQGSGGRGDAETKQPLFYTPSPLNVFGVDPKHFQKWLQVWDERRTFNDVQPSPDHPKKLNCVSPDFILRGTPLCSYIFTDLRFVDFTLSYVPYPLGRVISGKKQAMAFKGGGAARPLPLLLSLPRQART